MDVSDIFYFFLLGEGKGGSEAPGGGGGDGTSLKIPGGGGVREGAGGRQAWEGVCGELGGGGLDIFFGAEMPTKNYTCTAIVLEFISGV